jgi:hypothetical protein
MAWIWQDPFFVTFLAPATGGCLLCEKRYVPVYWLSRNKTLQCLHIPDYFRDTAGFFNAEHTVSFFNRSGVLPERRLLMDPLKKASLFLV